MDNLDTVDDIERGDLSEVDAPEPAKPHDTETAARIDWEAAGVAPPPDYRFSLGIPACLRFPAQPVAL